jgi:hypothetical protein
MTPSASVKKKSSVAAAKTMSSGAVPTEEEERVLLRDVKASSPSTKPKGLLLHVSADDGEENTVRENRAADKCCFMHGASRARRPKYSGQHKRLTDDNPHTTHLTDTDAEEPPQITEPHQDGSTSGSGLSSSAPQIIHRDYNDVEQRCAQGGVLVGPLFLQYYNDCLIL